MKILQYIGNALLFNKGYRKAGIIFWILIFVQPFVFKRFIVNNMVQELSP